MSAYIEGRNACRLGIIVNPYGCIENDQPFEGLEKEWKDWDHGFFVEQERMNKKILVVQ